MFWHGFVPEPEARKILADLWALFINGAALANLAEHTPMIRCFIKDGNSWQLAAQSAIATYSHAIVIVSEPAPICGLSADLHPMAADQVP